MPENEQLNTLITLFTGSVRNLSLYPKTHPTIQDSIKKINEILHGLLNKRREVLIAVIKNTLLVEKTPFYNTTKSIEEFIERLSNMGVNGIVFNRAVNDKEIIFLLESLLIPSDILKDKNGIMEKFKKAGIRGIEIKHIEEDVKTEASRTYTAARDEILDIMHDLRLGRIPAKTNIKNIISDLNDVMLKDKSTLMCLTMLQDYDEYTFNHSVNVGIFSLTLAQELGYKGEDLFNVGLAGILHDIGKTKVPREIILKPSQLTNEEWNEMKKHPSHGESIINEIGNISEISATFVLYHHIRYNLSGYPLSKIHAQPEGSRVVAIADTYDSMTTLRPYQRRFDPKESINLIKSKAGEDFDPVYVKAFIKAFGINPVGSVVRFDTNEVGVVTRLNDKNPERPFIKLIMDTSGNNVNPNDELSLEEKNIITHDYKRSIAGSIGSALQGLIDLNKYLK
ncbi:MAG: HD-GYP domain-containing protein [Deltaproteobacteria bacterium]|nr:HD-GYP domain-containing protein [Deltaproteobacteria bacterium]